MALDGQISKKVGEMNWIRPRYLRVFMLSLSMHASRRYPTFLLHYEVQLNSDIFSSGFRWNERSGMCMIKSPRPSLTSTVQWFMRRPISGRELTPNIVRSPFCSLAESSKPPTQLPLIQMDGTAQIYGLLPVTAAANNDLPPYVTIMQNPCNFSGGLKVPNIL